MEKQWHRLPVQALWDKLETEPTGLRTKEAQRRLAQVGPNSLSEEKPVPLWRKFLAQFEDVMILILVAATVVSAALGEWVDAVTILVIVLMNAVLGLVQEYRAEQSLAALKKLTAPEARVCRDGEERRMAASEVVPGDLVTIEAGDRVPADLRLIEVSDLALDESPLTGESLPVTKCTEGLGEIGISLGDQQNMAFAGTSVTSGRGRGLVVATGMQTEMGRIAQMIDAVEEEDTPLQKRLAQLGRTLVALCLVVCALVVAIGLWQGEAFYRMVLTGVSLAVAAIPEGLPAIVTIALAIGVQKMIRSQAIVRKLPAVETLGCVTVIGSDKTGTLTQNEMTVRRLYVGGEEIDVEGRGYEPIGAFLRGSRVIKPAQEGLPPKEWMDGHEMIQAALLCNNAEIRLDGEEKGKRRKSADKAGGQAWKLNGDPTEGALVVLAAKAGITREDVENEFTRVKEIPFDSDRKCMTVVVRTAGGGLRVYVKGAVETLLSLAVNVRRRGLVVPLDDAEKKRIMAANDAMASSALRVLAVACRELPPSTRDLDGINLEANLTFLGLAGMMDPPRPGVQQAVERCTQAGIRTVMITGDHPVTALAVARELTIASRSEEVVTGAQLDSMAPGEVSEAVARASVFARVSPEHKLRIVRTLRERGHIVAMTGDGVNDAPAVKEADIGIAMGRTGTDVTKEASSMVLADDNFVTIVTAVEQGRAIYDNIRKFIRYLLACNTGEVLVMFLASLLAMPLPLLPVQLLWVNLVTDGLPAMALGVEKPDPQGMQRPPRSPRESVLARGLGRSVLLWGTYCGIVTLAVFAWGLMLGDLALARTMALTTLTFFQLFYVFECRSETAPVFAIGLTSNRYLLGAVVLSAMMQLAVIYVPIFQAIFQTVPLELSHWLVILFFSGGWLLLTGLWYWIRKPARAVRRQHLLHS
ncbi:calcium-translocating P-type ATPase, SERCA-type [Heliophilum fasciatum]|uniref:P-type Ca(2+) transporter n=1 Tax=Heliophilum fasciatum TaxID=35700 RepID=A0A4R2RZ53_9FIRM|nr:calcium-translocating P-type ATPase, SERCA-type [Heliophilum fasciatum]MCW2277218.1 Ca2+-transporting ATPase [Heliophilum fasciatum]TCP68147.1 Ca2+-transporting ATPase [Heliophilum fasciatum]